jgi:hypothetical protein
MTKRYPLDDFQASVSHTIEELVDAIYWITAEARPVRLPV